MPVMRSMNGCRLYGFKKTLDPVFEQDADHARQQGGYDDPGAPSAGWRSFLLHLLSGMAGRPLSRHQGGDNVDDVPSQKKNDSDERSEVQDDIEEDARRLESRDQRGDDDQMGRTADRQRFRKPLDDAQYDGFQSGSQAVLPPVGCCEIRIGGSPAFKVSDDDAADPLDQFAPGFNGVSAHIHRPVDDHRDPSRPDLQGPLRHDLMGADDRDGHDGDPRLDGQMEHALFERLDRSVFAACSLPGR